MIPDLPAGYAAEVAFENPHVAVYLLPQARIVLCQGLKAYLPHEVFVETYRQIEGLVPRHGITKLVFDKQPLRIFNQASMVWYHVHWKQQMYEQGLKTFRKILPPDEAFRLAVSICRNNLVKEHPGFDLSKFDIRYCNSLAEALTE
jgi:hypothetical protein